MTAETKRAHYLHAKTTFHKVAKGAGDPVAYPDQLPQDPADFMRCYPTLWAARFGTTMPMLAKVDLAALTVFDSSYGCRGGVKRSVAPTQPVAVEPQAMQVQVMQQMQQTMQQFAMMMMHGRSADIYQIPRQAAGSRLPLQVDFTDRPAVNSEIKVEPTWTIDKLRSLQVASIGSVNAAATSWCRLVLSPIASATTECRLAQTPLRLTQWHRTKHKLTCMMWFCKSRSVHFA